jgi:hypothetical protein
VGVIVIYIILRKCSIPAKSAYLPPPPNKKGWGKRRRNCKNVPAYSIGQ